MAGSSKPKDNSKQLKRQQEEQARQEQFRLDQQRQQYETDRQNLLRTLADEQARQAQAQQGANTLLQQQAVQQGARQTELINQLRAQYGAQTDALGQQLEAYKSLAGNADQQKQYLEYLRTQSGANAQSEQERVQTELLRQTSQQQSRVGVLSKLAGQRTRSQSSEFVRGTGGGSVSSYTLLR